MKISHLNFPKSNSLLLIVTLIFFVACNTQKKEPAPEMDDQTAREIEPPKEIIPLNEAKELCENYENRRVPSIIKFEMAEANGEEKFVPTQFVAFKLETLQTYIDYVKQEAAKAKVSPDSLRIYLGNYGKEGCHWARSSRASASDPPAPPRRNAPYSPGARLDGAGPPRGSRERPAPGSGRRAAAAAPRSRAAAAVQRGSFDRGAGRR